MTKIEFLDIIIIDIDMQQLEKNSGTNKQLVAIITIMSLIFLPYMLPLEFMPIMSERLGISKKITGAIISVYPLGSVLATSVMGKY